MLKRLGAWDVTLPHPLFLEGAVWKKRQLELYDRGYPLEQPAGGAPSAAGTESHFGRNDELR